MPLGVAVVVAAAARVCGRGRCMLLCRLFLSLFAIIFIWQTQTTSWVFMLIYSTSRDSRVLESVFCCALRLQFLINFPPPARKRVLSQGLPSPPPTSSPALVYCQFIIIFMAIHSLYLFVIMLRFLCTPRRVEQCERAGSEGRRGERGTRHTLYRYTSMSVIAYCIYSMPN